MLDKVFDEIFASNKGEVPNRANLPKTGRNNPVTIPNN